MYLWEGPLASINAQRCQHSVNVVNIFLAALDLRRKPRPLMAILMAKWLYNGNIAVDMNALICKSND